MLTGKKIAAILLVGIFLISINTDANDRKITKTFEAKKLIKLKTISGDCILKKGDNDKIEVTVVSDYSPRDSFEPKFRESGETLRLTEKMYGSNIGNSTWIITAPPGTELDFSSASGSVSIQSTTGKFYGNTASGNYEIIESDGIFELSSASGEMNIDDCQGEFNLSSASGSIDATGIIIKDESDFSSASGNVKISLGAAPDFDLEVGSSSGQAVLDYAGNPIKGLIEMTAREKHGRIDAPFEFDKVENFRKNGQRYILKSIAKVEDNPVIEIKTASGRAELKE